MFWHDRDDLLYSFSYTGIRPSQERILPKGSFHFASSRLKVEHCLMPHHASWTVSKHTPFVKLKIITAHAGGINTHIFWYCTTAEKNWNKSPLCVECRYYLSTRVRSNMLHQNHVSHFFFRPPIPRKKFTEHIYEIHSNSMVLHIGIEHQPVYPASIIAVLGEEPILRLSTNVQTFPLTKKQLWNETTWETGT